MKSGNRHLTEEALIRLVIDPKDISAEERRHLETCPDCRDAVGGLSGDLAELKRRSVVLSPPVPGVRTNRPFSNVGFSFRPAFTVVAVLLVIGFTWFGVHLEENRMQKRTAALLQEIEADRRFLSEVDAAIAYSPAPIYPETGEGAELFFIEEFPEYIQPPDTSG